MYHYNNTARSNHIRIHVIRVLILQILDLRTLIFDLIFWWKMGRKNFALFLMKTKKKSIQNNNFFLAWSKKIIGFWFFRYLTNLSSFWYNICVSVSSPLLLAKQMWYQCHEILRYVTAIIFILLLNSKFECKSEYTKYLRGTEYLFTI